MLGNWIAEKKEKSELLTRLKQMAILLDHVVGQIPKSKQSYSEMSGWGYYTVRDEAKMIAQQAEKQDSLLDWFDNG